MFTQMLRFFRDVTEGKGAKTTTPQDVTLDSSRAVAGRQELFGSAKDIYEAYARDLELDLSGASESEHQRARESSGLSEAERLYRAAIVLCVEEHEVRDEALARHHLGILYHLQARFAECREEFTRAISILRSLPKTSRDDRKALSGAHFELGLMLFEMGALDAAREQFAESLRLEVAAGDRQGETRSREALQQCDWGQSAAGES